MTENLHPHIIWALRKRNIFTIKGSGSSMGWLIRDGDIVEVKKKTFSSLRVNDIVVIYLKKKLITHRVIYKARSYLITKGDANMIADGRVFPHQIIGEVEQIKREGKSIRLSDAYLIQSSYYFKEMVEIIRTFAKHKIQYVILKGLPLHLFYEGVHPRRIYADIDFMVKREDVKKSAKILQKLGFKAQEHSLSETHHRLKNHLVEIAYAKNIRGWYVVVDLHAEAAFLMTQLGDMNLLYPKRLLSDLSESFITHAKMIQLGGVSVCILSPSHLFIYLSLHFFHHNFQGMFRLELMNNVVKKMSFSSRQQTKIIKVIKKYRLENYMYPSLRLLQKYFPETKRKIKLIIGAIGPTTNYQLLTTLTPPIFDDESRLVGGIRRFILIFLASPQPFWKKLYVFFQPSVLFSVWWVFWRRISFFSKNRRR